MSPELQQAFRELDEEPEAQRVRTIEALRAYLVSAMPSRRTFDMCVEIVSTAK